MVSGDPTLLKVLCGPFACETVGGDGGFAGTIIAGAPTMAQFTAQSKPSFHYLDA